MILTFEHQEGKYEMPVHLGPHGSNSFSVAQLIASGAPDRNGNTLPATIVQGSLRIAGMSGSHKERLTVAIAGGIFNSRTGTCSYPCFDCIGGEYADGSPNAFDLPWSDGNGIGLVAFSDGSQEDYTSQASFSSEDTGVASQSGNQTTGQGLGSTFIDGSVEVTGNDVRRTCCGIAGCGEVFLVGSSEVAVVPKIFMGLNGNSPSQDISGTTQNVIIGQQIQLQAQYTLPAGDAYGQQVWDATNFTASPAIAGSIPGNNNRPIPYNTSGDSTQFVLDRGDHHTPNCLFHPQRASNPQPALSINISAPVGTLAAGDGLTLSVKVTNISSRRVELPFSLNSELGETLFDVTVTRADGATAPQTAYDTWNEKRIHFGSAGTVIIPAGSIFSDCMTVTKLFEMTEPGAYQIELVAKCDGMSTVHSNTLTVTVIPSDPTLRWSLGEAQR